MPAAQTRKSPAPGASKRRKRNETAKTQRLEARVTRDQKRLIAHAAGLHGVSVTDFLVRSAQAAATETIKDAQVLVLRGAAQAAFVHAILNPPTPSPAARVAAQRHKGRTK